MYNLSKYIPEQECIPVSVAVSKGRWVGVSAGGMCLPRGVVCLGGVSPRGCLPGQGVSALWGVCQQGGVLRTVNFKSQIDSHANVRLAGKNQLLIMYCIRMKSF